MDEGAHARAALWYDAFVVSLLKQQVECGCSWDKTTHLPVRKLATSVVHQRFRVNDGWRNACLITDDVTDLSGKLFAVGSGPPLSLLNQISELAYSPVSSKVAVIFPIA